MCDDKPPCKHITTLHEYKTEYNADSVEWCPHEPHQNVFVCANYQLNPETGKRVGCILLFSVTSHELILHQKIETEAVLDQKWCQNKINNWSFLGVTNAQKTLEIYALKGANLKLEFVTSCQLDDDSETLFLSLDWSTGKFASDEPEIVVSDSKGAIHRFKFCNNELIKADSWHGHEFEAWICAFYYWDPNVFFSGGDDCRFLKFDKRAGLEPLSYNRSHEAGVTSMHSNVGKEFILATGSYDETARFWDIRHLKNCVSSVKMPGPLWRLKWDPRDHKYLLAACMLGGVHIIENSEIIDSYYQHKNIAYGADWSHLQTNEPLISSCSFYDNLLCVSKVKLDK